MMQILKNIEARQMPKTKEYCSKKQYSDILYSWLQLNSEWDGVAGHPRKIAKNVVNFSELGRAWDLSRQTVSSRFKFLQNNLQIIEEHEDDPGYYYIKVLPNHVASLVPYKTLKLMNDTLNDNCISTYCYLLNRYIASGQTEFIFTISEIKSFLGLGTNTRSNNDTIINILHTLSGLKLLKYEKKTGKSDIIEGNIKTIYSITWMTNVVEVAD